MDGDGHPDIGLCIRDDDSRISLEPARYWAVAQLLGSSSAQKQTRSSSAQTAPPTLL